MRRVALFGLVAIMAAGRIGLATAGQADFPNRQVEFIIPFPPGGPTDAAARIIAPPMQAILKVPIVLTNKPGGGGALGGDYVAKSKPDGYTVFASSNAAISINTAMQKTLPYKMADFTPVGMYAADLGVLLARSSAPWKTLDELVAYAKKNPGKLTYGSAGVGTVSHFTVELFKLSYGVDIAHVPFQGTGPVKNAILGGHVDLGSSGFGSFAPLIKSGDLIPLVTTAPKRLPEYPNVPTMAERGFPEASLNIWVGLYVPAKTPPAVVEVLSRALAQAAKEPAVHGAMEKAGMVMDYRDGEGTRKLLEMEHGVVLKTVEKLGIGK